VRWRKTVISIFRLGGRRWWWRTCFGLYLENKKNGFHQHPHIIRQECRRSVGHNRTLWPRIPNGLKPVPFLSFEISPPSTGGILKLWDQSGTSYVPQCIVIETTSTNDLKSTKGTWTFGDQSGNMMMMKCEHVTNSYTTNIQFFHPFDVRDWSRMRKILSPLREVGSHFLWLELFRFKLLAVAQSDMWWIPDDINGALEDGTKW